MVWTWLQRSVVIGAMLLAAALPAGANKREAQGKIPPPKGCQWASSIMYYDVDSPGTDCFAYGESGKQMWVVTSVTVGTVEGEARIGALPFQPDSRVSWLGTRRFKGKSIEVRVVPAYPHQVLLMHTAKIERGKGQVYFAYREMDYHAIFSFLIRRIGSSQNAFSVLTQLGLVMEEDRRRAEAGRRGQQINLDPWTDVLHKLLMPFLKEAVFGCGDQEVAKRDALTSVIVNGLLKELDVGPAHRIMLSSLVNNWIAAYEEFLLFDLRNILKDDCARVR